MNDLSGYSDKKNGFTILEMILTIVVIAILAAYAYPKFSTGADIRLSVTFDKLKSDMYYAQELAMTTRTNCGIFIVNAGTYRIYKDGDTATPALDPGTFSDYEITLDATITIATTAAGSIIEFDSFGLPYDGDGVLTAEQQLILNGVKTLKVSPQTGWVHL